MALRMCTKIACVGASSNRCECGTCEGRGHKGVEYDDSEVMAGCGCGTCRPNGAPPMMNGIAEDVFDWLTGGPQKRAREARDQRRAAEAQRDAAIAEAQGMAEVERIRLLQEQERAAAREGLVVKVGIGSAVALAAYFLLR